MASPSLFFRRSIRLGGTRLQRFTFKVLTFGFDVWVESKTIWAVKTDHEGLKLISLGTLIILIIIFIMSYDPKLRTATTRMGRLNSWYIVLLLVNRYMIPHLLQCHWQTFRLNQHNVQHIQQESTLHHDTLKQHSRVAVTPTSLSDTDSEDTAHHHNTGHWLVDSRWLTGGQTYSGLPAGRRQQTNAVAVLPRNKRVTQTQLLIGWWMVRVL